MPYVTKLRRMNIRVTDRVYDHFRAESERLGLPMTGLINLALEQALGEQAALKWLPEFMAVIKEARGGEDAVGRTSGARPGRSRSLDGEKGGL